MRGRQTFASSWTVGAVLFVGFLRWGCGGVDVFGAFCNTAIAEVLDDLEDFRPRGERSLVDSLVFVDGHDELEEFAAHFAFFGGLANFTAAASRSAAAVEPHPPVGLSPIARSTPFSAAIGTVLVLWFA